ncbi:hypothetical protein HYC85_030630 [Camellia sinensis]|uniref:Uncharacterized protein n=1 Tax=Camellia sinensis TaxID=4442 RepID=A0A7J7G1C4_CAMSI|nr:hypothetical protein HYC85_030630 [Camellia sinensis]
MRHKSELETGVLAERFRDRKCTFLELFQVPGTPILLKICRELDILTMAGDPSSSGGFPGAGDSFDPMTLPPRVRPFIPGRYRPRAHNLPRAVFRHFTSFDEGAPGDLLLREPEQHLSHEAREVFTSPPAFFEYSVPLPCFNSQFSP